MDTEPFKRVLSEQSTNVDYTSNQISQSLHFKTDYENLIDKIKILQKSLSVEAYLPFGRRALIPGRLIHTNEYLVYLGDDHFAELSAHDTVFLLERRVTDLNGKIERLRKQKSLLEDRIAFTKDLVRENSVFVPKSLRSFPLSLEEKYRDMEEVEIREEYDSDIEVEWKKQHAVSCKAERLEIASRTSPLLTSRKVSFADESESECGEIESTKFITDSDSDDPLPIIYFEHSGVLSPKPRNTVHDLSSLTVSEAVNMIMSFGLIKSTPSAKTLEPFGDVVERKPCNDVSLVMTDKVSEKQRCSHFRASRTN